MFTAPYCKFYLQWNYAWKAAAWKAIVAGRCFLWLCGIETVLGRGILINRFGQDLTESRSVWTVTSIRFDPADRLIFIEWVLDWEVSRSDREVLLGNISKVFDVRA